LVLATPHCAFFPDVFLNLATPVRHLAYSVFAKIIFGIDTLFYDCLDLVHVFITPSCVHDSMALSYARGFKCGYIHTGNPDHDIDHDIPSHGHLDQGCSSLRSRLHRHRHNGDHLA
jgi:hypothetical protein